MGIIEGFNGQAGQDAFTLWALNEKRDGYFLEIGSNDPIDINNTYVLENIYGWRGVMVEYHPKYLSKYLQHRPTAIHIIEDATQVDYIPVLEKLSPPGKCLDYLQIDLEVNNDSTMEALKRVEETMRAGYKYAVVTFEHDVYTEKHNNTRERSRPIFEAYGYKRVFEDVMNEGCAYEDWYVHPELVDMERIEPVRTSESLEWRDILDRLRLVE